jgi:hypothetical protein
MGVALPNLATHLLLIVLEVHTIYSRERAALFAAILWHSALELKISKYPKIDYQRAAGCFSETIKTGRFDRAYRLVQNIYHLYQHCTAKGLVWQSDTILLTQLLCIEAGLDADKTSKCVAAAKKLSSLTSHSGLVLATHALSASLSSISHACKYSGIIAHSVLVSAS